MKKFKAITGNGSPIITVVAENRDDAFDRIREQLRCPGRFSYFEAWVVGGFKLEEAEVVRGDHFGAVNTDLFKKEK